MLSTAKIGRKLLSAIEICGKLLSVVEIWRKLLSAAKIGRKLLSAVIIWRKMPGLNVSRETFFTKSASFRVRMLQKFPEKNRNIVSTNVRLPKETRKKRKDSQ